MIEKLLNGMNDAVSSVSTETALAMYEAMEATLHASKFDQRTHQARFLRLLMKCASEGKQKEVMGKFTTALLAADYYFSAGWANKAIPHLELAVALFQEQYGGPLLSEDKDAIVGAFRSRNLKGKFRREFNAVRNIYILSGAAHKLGLDLPLEELPADVIPTCWSIMDFPIFILLGVTGGLLIMYGLDDYRTARLAGTPIPITEALQAGEIFSIIIGIVLIIAEFAVMMRQYNPTYNRWMSKYYYWRFSR